MEHDLTEQTRQRIAEHCRKISVAHNLDPEIQRELAGHMEDKILGYLGGQEPLTEDDAFVIARERFGDPARIKELLGATHAGEAAVSAGRRVLTIFLTQKLIFLALALLVTLGLAIRSLVFGKAPIAFPPPEYDQLFQQGIVFINLFILFLALRRWRRVLATGGAPWFTRWPLAAMFAAIVLLHFIAPFQSLLRAFFTLPVPSNFKPQWLHLHWLVRFYTSLDFIMLFATLVLWLWWCDSTPRRKGAIFLAIFGYALFYESSFFIRLIKGAAAAEAPANAAAFLKVNGWVYYWNWSLSPVPWSLHAGVFVIIFVLGLLAWFTYTMIRKIWARRHASDDDPLISG